MSDLSNTVSGAPEAGEGQLGAEAIIRLVDVTKSYGTLVAVSDVSFDVKRGEICAVVGENGAGKTTLMGIICGLVTPDSGEIWLGENRVTSYSARRAVRMGISYVQQHYSLIPTQTVAQNLELFLRGKGVKMSSKKVRALAASVSAEHGLHIDPTRLVSDLSVGDQQRAELLKALAAEPRLIVLDEPTALLSAEEAADLERILCDLTERGTGIVYVSHKLDEVMRLADRITVIRRGRVVGSVSRSDASKSAIGALMVGSSVAATGGTSVREVPDARRRPEPGGGLRPTLEVVNVSVEGGKGVECVRDVSLAVHAGEAVGLAGVEGSGHLELVEGIAGLRKVTRGEVLLEGTEITRTSIRARRRLGVSFVPSDRRGVGLFGGMSVADNLAVARLGTGHVARWGIIRGRSNDEYSRHIVERYDVRVPGIGAAVGGLSGGNQQKLLVGREIEMGGQLLLLNSPTWGLDFAAAEMIHALILEARDAGKAVLLASVDLEELMQLSDRVVVFAGGKVVGEVSPEEGVSTELGLMLGGSTSDSREMVTQHGGAN